MMISTKGRYALRVMIDLAEHDGAGPIALKDIAERQAISEKYLESIIAQLARAGYVQGHRGKGGGYLLTRRPAQYTVLELLVATEGPLVPVACMEQEHNGCSRASECKTLPMWKQLGDLINGYLGSISLEDLAAGPYEQGSWSI